MAIKYPYDENTRVAILTVAPADPEAPTTAELEAGLDATCELTADGLKWGKGNNSISAGGLCSGTDSTVPGRTTFGASLVGFKFKQPDATPLWDLAIKGNEAWIYARYGMAHDEDWTNGDEVEGARYLWGKRSTADTGTDTLATFTAPMHIQEDYDDAVVGGGS